MGYAHAPMPALPESNDRPSPRAIGALLANALIWGVSWLPFRWLSDQGLHSLWATAVIFLVAWLFILARNPAAIGISLRHPGLLALGLASGLTNACFNWGISTGEVMRVVLLFYLMPVWAVLLAWLMLDEPLRLKSIGLVLLAVSGAAIVLYQPGAGLPMPASHADWLGLFGGMGFAMNNVLLRRQAAAPAAARAAAMFAGGAFIPACVALFVGLTGTAVPWPTLQTSAITGLIFIAALFVLGNYALQYGASRLPTRVTAVIMLSEVVFAAVSATWLGGEVLTLRLVLGAALIIAASVVSSVQTK